MNTATPPRWAETILRLLLVRHDREPVSGDLLDEYRRRHLARGPHRADLWYVKQVGGVTWRAHRLWAILFGAAVVARTALDWLMPTVDFNARSTMSTALGVAILLCAGFWAAWRSGSLWAGALAGVVTSFVAAIISIAGATVLLALWHDRQTLAAIRGSGGLEEVFTLPLAMIIPATCVGTLGGVVGDVLRKAAAYVSTD